MRRSVAGAQPVLAVLPFENLSRLAQDEYLADTITETLTNEVGRCATLRVIPRQSVLHLKGSTLTLAEIARELGADAVLEGTTLRAKGRLLVTAELLAVGPDRHLWSGSQEGDLGEPFALCRRVAQQFAAAIERTLGADPYPATARPKAPPDRHLSDAASRPSMGGGAGARGGWATGRWVPRSPRHRARTWTGSPGVTSSESLRCSPPGCGRPPRPGPDSPLRRCRSCAPWWASPWCARPRGR